MYIWTEKRFGYIEIIAGLANGTTITPLNCSPAWLAIDAQYIGVVGYLLVCNTVDRFFVGPLYSTQAHLLKHINLAITSDSRLDGR
jgi:hypothetical protein